MCCCVWVRGCRHCVSAKCPVPYYDLSSLTARCHTTPGLFTLLTTWVVWLLIFGPKWHYFDLFLIVIFNVLLQKMILPFYPQLPIVFCPAISSPLAHSANHKAQSYNILHSSHKQNNLLSWKPCYWHFLTPASPQQLPTSWSILRSRRHTTPHSQYSPETRHACSNDWQCSK